MRSSRRWLDRVLLLVSGGCALLAVVLLTGLVGAIVLRGLPALDLGFVLDPTRAAGAGGGVRYQLLGTAILITTAGLVALPLALGLALSAGYFLGEGPARRSLELVLYALNGVPSILFGVLGYLVFVQGLGWGKSWLTGGVLLALVMLPTVAVAVLERVRALPTARLEAAAALGLSRGQTVRAVVLPHCRGGLVTGLLLGLARAAGETAPLLFTATVFAGATLPTGVRDEPVLALPYHIFVLAQDSFDPAVREHVWSAALLLLLLVLLLSALALPWRLLAHEEARRG